MYYIILIRGSRPLMVLHPFVSCNFRTRIRVVSHELPVYEFLIAQISPPTVPSQHQARKLYLKHIVII